LDCRSVHKDAGHNAKTLEHATISALRHADGQLKVYQSSAMPQEIPTVACDIHHTKLRLESEAGEECMNGKIYAKRGFARRPKPFLLSAGFAAALLAACGVAAAANAQQNYPDKPVRILVGTPPGSSTDLAARVTAAGLEKKLGQSFVVENRAGAATNIATGAVARAPNDGYTLLWASNSNTMNVSMMKNLPFDFEKDFAPIAMAVQTPLFFVINPQIPAKTVQEFVALAKAAPGKYNFATTGKGSANHLAVTLFSLRSGIKLTTVYYKGSTAGVTDILSGRVHAMFSPGSSAIAFVNAGKLRALAVTSRKRTAIAPEIPTMIESGIPNFEVTFWNGLAAPTGTPPAIIEKLSKATTEIVSSPEYLASAKLRGSEPLPMDAKEFAAYIKADIVKWAEVAKAAGLEPK
jgi:tripartite-type tricarboxylate transporter receptor subunit TctC